ncbi:hypothetical protein DFH09DRAFT_1086769 [Mycena vulgaris]|nr:hypothetical protein DFH09DRAFT_1086769 [Mycena vulgaris]
MADQCAVSSGGDLFDASNILFYGSESDETALPTVTIDQPPQRRSTRKTQTDRLTQSLAAEHEDEDGETPARFREPVSMEAQRVWHVWESRRRSHVEEGEASHGCNPKIPALTVKPTPTDTIDALCQKSNREIEV